MIDQEALKAAADAWLLQEGEGYPNTIALEAAIEAYEAAKPASDDALAKMTAERDDLAEDRARFPDKPDGIGRMIEAHIGNLKLGKEAAEQHAHRALDRAIAAETALTTALAERDALREALKPFAVEAKRIYAVECADTTGDSVEIWQSGSVEFTRSRITYGDLRAAARALAKPATDAAPAPDAKTPLDKIAPDGQK